MKEGGQGTETIEKTRWDGDKTIIVERLKAWEKEEQMK